MWSIDLITHPQANASDLHEFATAHQRFVIYLETLTPYLQLRYKSCVL